MHSDLRMILKSGIHYFPKENSIEEVLVQTLGETSHGEGGQQSGNSITPAAATTNAAKTGVGAPIIKVMPTQVNNISYT